MIGPHLKKLRPLLATSWGMNLAVALLLVIGVFFVYSSCYISTDLPVRSLYKKQIVWGLIGTLCYVGFALVDYRTLRKFAWTVYLAALVMLVLVLMIGTRIYGARRWLMLFGENGIGIQPSELAKVAVILLLARRLSLPGEMLRGFWPVVNVLVIAGLPVLLIMQQPDLGTAMVFLPVTFIMMFVAGMPARTMATLFLIGLCGIGIVVGAVFVPRQLDLDPATQEEVMQRIGLSAYHKRRIEVFFGADEDPLGAGWNKRQSQIAVGSGGAWGKGFLKGTQNILGFLPRSVAPTDFIYSVIAEEKGFFGSSVVLFLFAVVIGAGVRTAYIARDKLGRLLCVGIVGLLFSHVFVNIAMTVGLMPITGLPLPLLSYGGSFMLITLSALGVIQSVHIRSQRRPIIYEQGRLWKTAPGSV